MTDTKRLTDDQVQEIRKLQFDVDATLRQYGMLHLQKKIIDAEIAGVEQGIEQLEQQRIALITKIQEQFGSTGSINLDTGEFVSD